jgi:hypothetical protein
MVRDWITKIAADKKGAQELEEKQAQRRGERRKRFEDRIGAIRIEIAKLFSDAIEEFNSTRPQDEPVSCDTPPELVIMAHKTTYPAGYLQIEIDPVTELLVCHYGYSKKRGVDYLDETAKFHIDVAADDYSFFCPGTKESLNNELLLERVLEPFLRRL